jgi:hypothetical protein
LAAGCVANKGVEMEFLVGAAVEAKEDGQEVDTSHGESEVPFVCGLDI